MQHTFLLKLNWEVFSHDCMYIHLYMIYIYILITSHPWMRRHGPKAHAECSTRRERDSNLISTYQVSSARLERQSAQRMKSVVPRSGFEPEPPDFRPGVLTTRPSWQLTFWAYALLEWGDMGPLLMQSAQPGGSVIGEQHFSFFEHSAFLALLMRLDKSKWDCYIYIYICVSLQAERNVLNATQNTA